MTGSGQWNHKVFPVQTSEFEALALEIFLYQYSHDPVYKAFVMALKADPTEISRIEQIPFLPIRFFKSHEVRCGLFEPEAIFESSGTTGSINSKHYVKDLSLYKESFTRSFELFYGPVQDWCIIGLLPSYLEKGNSSLVYMTDQLIKMSGHSRSGFYLYELDQLAVVLEELEAKKQKTMLIGVTYALLDFAEKYPQLLRSTVIVETGGMKGRREEMIRPEVHRLLKEAFGQQAIHSEYGMTELLSQAWSKGEGRFVCPPWMRLLIRDEEDTFQVKQKGSGIINIIDLANIHSCTFIATDDVGRIAGDGSFEVLGRMDGSDLRGCSLMLIE
jgi:phenylacetate-coenzyme A ligase PaaK-like adenylate-forming protein